MSTTHDGVVLVQSTVPEFRRDFISVLLGQDESLVVLAGREGYEPTVRLFEGAEAAVSLVSNRFLLGRRALWQGGAFRRSVGASAAVLELNPRTLSTWCILLARRVLGRPTVGWSHVWPRSGPDSRTVPVRRAMWRLTDAALLYTDAERDELTKMQVHRPAAIAPNAVNSRERVVPASGPRRHVLQIGRLVPAKKPDLMVRGFAAAADDLPAGTELWFVGDGPMRDEIETLSASLGLSGRVRTLGAVHEAEKLKLVFDECLFVCSPGYAGLSVTQALSFGLPCVVADREPHAPEISLTDDTNSRTFAAGSVMGLRAALVEMFDQRAAWLAATERISRRCLDQYSAEAMAAGLLDAVMLAKGRSKARAENHLHAAHNPGAQR